MIIFYIFLSVSRGTNNFDATGDRVEIAISRLILLTRSPSGM
jgi:hypothetical protein